MASQRPLQVIVVGAGIAGLSAAIALRRVGHDVTIYERSDLNNELGAAIHLCPNASRILLAWGMDPVGARFVTVKSGYIANGKTLSRVYENEYSAVEQRFGAPWFFTHRIDLHTELKRLATTEDGLGRPAILKPHCRVVGYNHEAGSITLADSTSHTGDLIVIADGVHSIGTEVVLGSGNPAIPTDQIAYRFLIPSSVLRADPETAHFLEGDDGRFKIFTGDEEGKRLVWYPCRNNEEQNLVGIIHHHQERDIREDWDVAAAQSELLSKFRDFHPSLLSVMKKATEVKKWPLLYRSPLRSWHRQKLVLIGDAAHPMLPHQGQAGAQAIEDSAALATMVQDLSPDNIHSDPNLLQRRLELFEGVRMKRASTIQIFSNVGQDQAEKIEEAVKPYFQEWERIPGNPAELMVYNFGHDVLKASSKALEDSKSQ